jgi:hypothetical protein
MNSQVVPWVAVGFVLGAAAGFAWGKTAKAGIGDAVTTKFDGGKLSVTVDTVEAARSGFGDSINGFLDGVF